jgi:hypothetical protein
LPRLAREPVFESLDRSFGGLRPESEERERDNHQRELDDDETNHSEGLHPGGRFRWVSVQAMAAA